MNNDNFLVEEIDLELAKKTCKNIENPIVRNRAVANVLAASLAKNYFTDITADTESGLYRIAAVLNKIDISDIYINDSYIDVRIYFESNELCVPKIHFEKGILPAAYMFIKVDPSLSGALVTGFALPSNIDTTNDINGYYFITEDDLISYYDIEGLLVQNYTDDAPERFEMLIFDYLDNRLDDDAEFYKALLASKYCRNLLKNAANVQNIFENISLENRDENNMIVKEEEEEEEIFETESENDLLEEDDNDINFDLELETPDLALETEVLEEDITSDTTVGDLLEVESSDLEEVKDFDTIEDLSIDIVDEEIEPLIDDTGIEDSSDIEDINASVDSLEVIDTDNESIEEYEPISEQPVEPVDASVPALEYEELPNFEQPEEIEEIPIEEFSEENSFEEVAVEERIEEFSTVTTPSIDSIEEETKESEFEETELAEDDLEAMLDNDNSVFDKEEAPTKTENTPQIENLFGDENEAQEVIDEEFIQPARKNSKVLPLIATLTIVAALGYFGYTKFTNTEAVNYESTESSLTLAQQEEVNKTSQNEAMPVESIENIDSPQANNEGNAISIPAIEQNLDASILVSNLSVNWEVPNGYISNNTAKRYLTKMGKIIQLNLKTELLLLSKPPITNKIVLELEYNKALNRFNVKGVTVSSGEKVVDDLIVQTVKNALNINLKTNMSAFGNISGNPVLVIRL